MEQLTKPATQEGNVLPQAIHRRKFLGILGASASVVAVATACSNNDDDNPPYDGATVEADGTVNLGKGDVGILNYAFALEQLEAAFYTQVIATPYNGITDAEKARLTEIRDHEIAHREYFKAALGSKGIPALEVNFTAITFTDKASVLGAAKTFEDLGVAAYNGAGPLIVTGAYLLTAGKIVSVEARHAAYIADLLQNGTFANTTDANGLDPVMAPPAVLTAAAGFLKTKVTGKDLPTS